MRYLSFLILVSFILLFSCNSEETKPGTLFTLLPSSKTKVDFTNKLTETKKFNIIQYLYFNNGAGVAAGDINNDGLVDLYFTSNQNSNKLYLNKGNLVFEDITKKAGVAGVGDWTTGVTMADVNGDGLLDIYVCQVGNYKNMYGKNQLFINGGDLTFIDKAAGYGLDFQGFSTQAAFFDYDLDGDLDLYLLNHSVHTSRSYGDTILRFENDTRAGDRLYRNDKTKDGSRFFTEVTSEAGIYSSQIGYGLGVNIADINNDGFPDIYISNDFHENDYLYINNGDGTFNEQLTEMIAHTSRSSMGNDIGDFNNDGLLDIIVLDMLPDNEQILKQSGGEDDYELSEIKRKYGYNYQFVRNTLQLNLGGGLFSEIGRLSGIYATDWSWSPLFCDLDNDGNKDIFITNGIYRRANDLDYVKFLTGGNRFFPTQDNSNVPDRVLYEKMPLYPNINYLYKNNGDLTFTNMSKSWGFETRSYSNGSTYADLDNDGDLDLVVNNINSTAYIYKNNSDTQLHNHFLTVKFNGEGLNTRGVGARVYLFCGNRKLVAEQFATRGFLSATSDVLHFGLGKTKNIDSLIVRWPDKSEEILYNLPADQVLVLKKENSKKQIHLKEKKNKTTNEKLFRKTSVSNLEFTHKEDNYSDFIREQLIPHSLSEEGPALAVGDINNDGLEDVFIGGAKDQPAKLFTQQPNGTFKTINTPVLINDRFTEDVDAIFFDADGDADLDLYIVRGGNEAMLGNPLLADRLLINNGHGGFEKCKRGSLPYLANNGSCICSADFDNDGDLDLFIGSISVPGAYGLSPNQVILENNGKGIFKDITTRVSEGLRNVGMVTDASWFDYDGDNDLDLVVVGEWMDISLFNNDEGHFTNVTETSNLDKTSGWWSTIKIGDIDNDGDLDMICGNLGLNSILEASVQKPVEMYLNDFDNNGSLDQIICSYKNNKSYPVASLDQLVRQIPALKQKYPHYSDFGEKTVIDIFGKETISQSIRKKIVLLESCIFLNNNDGTFKLNKLPIEAQFSPVRDILIDDFNNDKVNDILLIGNNYAVRPSFGRYDASYGWCLLGDKKSSFNVLTPVESGFVVIGDARRIVPLNTTQNRFLLTAINNGKLQIFQEAKNNSQNK